MSVMMKNVVPEKENVADKMEKFSLKVIYLNLIEICESA